MSSSSRIGKQAISWLVKLNSPDMTKDQHREFFEWLESSEQHQSEFVKAEQAWQSSVLISDLPKKHMFSSLYFSASLISAICIICIAIYLFYPVASLSPDETVFASTATESLDVELSDGSSVSLYRDTQFSFSQNAVSRILKLKKGEVFLDVAKDAVKPFYVEVHSSSVRVLGTQFSVRRMENDAQVTVLEGRVGILEELIDLSEGVEQEPVIVVMPNQQVQFSSALKGEQALMVDARVETAWKDGRVVFNSQTLQEVVLKINRHFQKPLVIKHNELEERLITGVISLQDPFKAANTLARITGATVFENSLNNSIELDLHRN